MDVQLASQSQLTADFIPHSAATPTARRLRSTIVIPARLASTRLPRKLLLAETGKPLIQHTYESACRATRPTGVLVAADCEEIAAAVRSFGGQVAMTSPDCASGTDRVAEIARQLAAIGRNSQLQVEPQGAEEQTGESGLARILQQVRSATGVDFTHYKRGTLERRIKRRMALRGFEKLEDYSRDLEQNRPEAAALCENCFITVTSFFREPAVFEELSKKVFPALLENRTPGDPIRIWVAGCASGEEAYSIAICLREFLDDANVSMPFEIFATDISETAVEYARAGVYSGTALARISPERLARFFTGTERGYQVAAIIRDSCLFARHNVAQDPPFSRLDLVSCCNVLIYLGPELQRKVMSIQEVTGIAWQLYQADIQVVQVGDRYVVVGEHLDHSGHTHGHTHE